MPLLSLLNKNTSCQIIKSVKEIKKNGFVQTFFPSWHFFYLRTIQTSVCTLERIIRVRQCPLPLATPTKVTLNISCSQLAHQLGVHTMQGAHCSYLVSGRAIAKRQTVSINIWRLCFAGYLHSLHTHNKSIFFKN